MQVNNCDAVLTFFPAGRGFFVRAGGGLAAFSYEAESAWIDASDAVGGVGLLAGVGWAFWLGESFNLTLNLDWSGQRYRSGSDPYGLIPDSSSFWSAYVGFDWY